MNEPEPLILVTTTCASASDAEALARAALEARLAACVQISPIRSLYWWEEQIHNEPEFLLFVKALRSDWPALETLLSRVHPYEIPEILAVDIASGNTSYLSWVSSVLAAGSKKAERS